MMLLPRCKSVNRNAPDTGGPVWELVATLAESLTSDEIELPRFMTAARASSLTMPPLSPPPLSPPPLPFCKFSLSKAACRCSSAATLDCTDGNTTLRVVTLRVGGAPVVGRRTSGTCDRSSYIDLAARRAGEPKGDVCLITLRGDDDGTISVVRFTGLGAVTDMIGDGPCADIAGDGSADEHSSAYVDDILSLAAATGDVTAFARDLFDCFRRMPGLRLSDVPDGFLLSSTRAPFACCLAAEAFVGLVTDGDDASDPARLDGAGLAVDRGGGTGGSRAWRAGDTPTGSALALTGDVGVAKENR